MRLISLILLLGMFLTLLPFNSLAQESKNAQYEQKARALIEALARQDFAAAVKDFDENMKTGLPTEKLAEVWKQIISQVGNFKGISGARLDKTNQQLQLLDCDFDHARLEALIAFEETGKIAGFFMRPSQPTAAAKVADYIKPELFREEEVKFGLSDWPLPGTLTLPQGQGPFAAVVLVHGSGPNDRDETIGPNKPFRDLAQGLASRNIAVLRYDKRTRVYGAKLVSENLPITVKEETVDDAVAAVAFLRQHKQIDSKQIFVLGHSLGGMLIPRIGKADSNIAGLIVLAGTTRPLEDVVVEQFAYLFSLDSKVSPEEQKQLDEIKAGVAQVKALSPANKEGKDRKMLLGIGAGYWQDLRGYHPPTLAKELSQSMLILQGERDYQVTLVDYKGWQDALQGKTKVTLKTYPKLNHLFIAGEGTPSPAEYSNPGNVEAVVVEDIANWINKQK